MSEAIKITLVNTGVFDGSSAINISRSDLGEPNAYTGNISGGGVITASVLDLMAPKTAKLISIAGDTRGYPGAVVRVTSPTDPDSVREEIVLQTNYQRVLLAGDEVLRILWYGDGTRNRTVHLVVQDLAERECTPFMRVEHRPSKRMNRFSIRSASALLPGPNHYQPQWTFAQGVFQTELTATAGHFDINDFFPSLSTDGKGCYVWVKFGGVTPADVGRSHWVSNDYFAFATNLPPEKWSDPMWISENDRLVLRAAPNAGSMVRADIEVSPLMLRRLSGAK